MGTKRPISNTSNVETAKKRRIMNFNAHPRRKIAIQFLYLGWHHDGLVQQPNTKNTVENHLMEALLKTHLIEDWTKCELSRCGRTDKGVSAFKQTAALIVRSNCPDDSGVFWDDSTPEEIKTAYKSKEEELPYIKMLNGVLPKTIRAFAWAPVSQKFNARFDCNKRTYKYSFAKADLNLEKMQEAAELLVGEHDYSNFCQIDMNQKRLEQSYVRKIFDVKVEQVSQNPDNDIFSIVELTVTGSGFLWHMIRYIVTVLQEIGRENETPSLISELLDHTKFPSRPQYTLSSDTPLCLYDCGYNTEDVEWRIDEKTLTATVTDLQKKWAIYQTRSRMMENMLGELTQMAELTPKDMTKGLHEFVQDRPISANYVKFKNRSACESIESKKEKLAKKILLKTTENS